MGVVGRTDGRTDAADEKAMAVLRVGRTKGAAAAGAVPKGNRRPRSKLTAASPWTIARELLTEIGVPLLGLAVVAVIALFWLQP